MHRQIDRRMMRIEFVNFESASTRDLWVARLYLDTAFLQRMA
jgi:hypothetical protein